MKAERLQKLIRYLADAEGEVPGSELAAHFHTTTRTIRNYVSEINSTSSENPLIVATRRGYTWNVLKENIVITVPGKPDPQSPSERTAYILRQLLYRQEVSFERLMGKLAVSDRTLEEDLVQVKRILFPYDILIKRRGDLLKLYGSALQRRLLIYKLIIKTVRLEYFTLSFLESVFPEFSASAILHKTEEILKLNNLRSDAYVLCEVTLRVMIQLQQILSGNMLTEEPSVVEDRQRYPDHIAAAALADYLEQEYEATYSDIERTWLTDLLISKALPEPEVCLKEVQAGYPRSLIELYGFAGEILRHAENALCGNPDAEHTVGAEDRSVDCKLVVNLTGEPVFSSLTIYMHRLLLRQKLGFVFSRPANSRMQSGHPILYKIAAELLFSLSRKFNVPIANEEIPDFAILLGMLIRDEYVFEGSIDTALICPYGQEMAERIRGVLEQRIGHLLCFRDASFIPDTRILTNLPQLTLSLVPLHNVPHCVHISPFPKSDDYRRIYSEVLLVKREMYAQKLEQYLNRFFSENDYYPGLSVKTETELIRHVCKALISDGCVDKGFEAFISDYLQFDKGILADTTVISLFCSDSVYRARIVAATSEERLHWFGQQIDTVILLLCNPDQLKTFMEIYDLTVRLLSRAANKRLIKGARTAHEFREALVQV